MSRELNEITEDLQFVRDQINDLEDQKADLRIQRSVLYNELTHAGFEMSEVNLV